MEGVNDLYVTTPLNWFEIGYCPSIKKTQKSASNLCEQPQCWSFSHRVRLSKTFFVQLYNCTFTQLHNCTYLWLHPAPHSRIRSDATESSTKSSFWPFTLVIILIRMVKLVKFNLVIILMRMVGDVGGETWSIETQPRSPEFTPTPGATFTWNQHNCHHHNYDHRHQLAKCGPHRSIVRLRHY